MSQKMSPFLKIEGNMAVGNEILRFLEKGHNKIAQNVTENRQLCFLKFVGRRSVIKSFPIA